MSDTLLSNICLRILISFYSPNMPIFGKYEDPTLYQNSINSDSIKD